MKSKIALIIITLLVITTSPLTKATAESTSTFPDESEKAFLFYDQNCRDCRAMIIQLNRLGLRSAVRVQEIRVSQDPEFFRASMQQCDLDPGQVQLPVLSLGNDCYSGLEVIKTALEQKFADYRTNVLAGNTGNLPIVTTGVDAATAKKNTLIFIGGMTLGLILLVVVGYALEGRKKDRKRLEKDIEGLAVILSVILSITAAGLVAGRLFLVSARAFCPVCTVAVGAGLVFAKEMGIDDVISSIWVGGLLLSMSLWLINWLRSKKVRFPFLKIIIFLVMYGLVIVPFMISQTIGAPYNRLWGIDKIVLGIILGTAGFVGGMILSNYILKKNHDKVYFPFQKVVVPITMLIVLSLVFYFIVY